MLVRYPLALLYSQNYKKEASQKNNLSKESLLRNITPYPDDTFSNFASFNPSLNEYLFLIPLFPWMSAS